MSALLRPLGDEIATVYGAYKSKKDVKKIVKGDKLDILCSDGLNYHVEVKETGAAGRLHFRHWSVKHDYIGSFDDLYLATQGTYSEGISAQNTYPTLKGDDKSKSSSISKPVSSNSGTDSRPQNFPSGTRYPEDFLSKPRFASSHSRKRVSEEVDEIDGKKKVKDEVILNHAPPKTEKVSEMTAITVAESENDLISVLVESKTSIRTRRSSIDRRLSQEKAMIQEQNKSEGEGSESKPILNGKIESEISVIVPPATSAEESSPSTSSNKNHSDSVDSDIRTEPALNNILPIAVEDIPVVVSTEVTSVHAVLVPQQASRVVPVYQQTSQRAAQIKYLREILSTDKSMFDTGRAIDIVSNHPIVFQIPGSTGGEGRNPHFTAKQLVALLQARRKIDEVIHHVLGTL
jgi:hypothetical protein